MPNQLYTPEFLKTYQSLQETLGKDALMPLLELAADALHQHALDDPERIQRVKPFRKKSPLGKALELKHSLHHFDGVPALRVKELGKGGNGRVALFINAKGECFAIKSSKVWDGPFSRQYIESRNAEYEANQKMYGKEQVAIYQEHREQYTRFWIKLPYFPGMSLNKFEEANAGKRTFSRAEVLEWMFELACDLQKMHAIGYAHRDVDNAGNVFMVEREGGFTARLIDYGCIEKARDYTNFNERSLNDVRQLARLFKEILGIFKISSFDKMTEKKLEDLMQQMERHLVDADEVVNRLNAIRANHAYTSQEISDEPETLPQLYTPALFQAYHDLDAQLGQGKSHPLTPLPDIETTMFHEKMLSSEEGVKPYRKKSEPDAKKRLTHSVHRFNHVPSLRVRHLGRGCYGHVSLHINARGENFAVKTVLVKTDKQRLSISNEIAASKLMYGEEVVHSFERQLPNGDAKVMIVMPFFSGRDGWAVTEHRKVDGIFPDLKIDGYIELAEQLKKLHDNHYVHGDIGTSNMMFEVRKVEGDFLRNSELHFRLIDFGLAKHQSQLGDEKFQTFVIQDVRNLIGKVLSTIEDEIKSQSIYPGQGETLSKGISAIQVDESIQTADQLIAALKKIKVAMEPREDLDARLRAEGYHKR